VRLSELREARGLERHRPDTDETVRLRPATPGLRRDKFRLRPATAGLGRDKFRAM
jgi:hypothetical protein